MRIWGLTDTGLVRAENQDAYTSFHLDDYGIGIVCDGMGGTTGGQVASSLAVNYFQKELRKKLKQDMSFIDIGKMMCHSIEIVNNIVHGAAISNIELRQMGTTLVAAVCNDREVSICNVGDSRAYLINDDGITQISKDHSIVGDLLAKGELTPAQAKHHPSRNLITRALGPDSHCRADEFNLRWDKGDYILLCSDGLVNTVTDQEILFEVIHGGDIDDCLMRLLSISKDNGAPDNITIVLIENL